MYVKRFLNFEEINSNKKLKSSRFCFIYNDKTKTLTGHYAFGTFL